jgi:hypothetical protein
VILTRCWSTCSIKPPSSKPCLVPYNDPVLGVPSPTSLASESSTDPNRVGEQKVLLRIADHEGETTDPNRTKVSPTTHLLPTQSA